MTAPVRWALVVIAALLGVLFLEARSASAHEREAAVQAARAADAAHVADSVAKQLDYLKAQARVDSTLAARSRADAAKARARSDSFAWEASSLRRRLTVVGDSGIRVAGDTAIHYVPREVVQQLHVDSVALAAGIVTIQQQSAALALAQAEAASLRSALSASEDRSAALVRENQALAKEVKALQPPKCGTTCGAIIGAASVGALLYLVKR